MKTVPLLLTPDTVLAEAQAVSQDFALPLVTILPAATEFYLQFDAEGLGLWQHGTRFKPVRVEFVGGRQGFRRQHGGGRQQPLARAIGLKPGQSPIVIDATAGLGRDAFVLACLGCTVYMIERSPVVAALLNDGLQRAALEPNLQPLVTRQLHLLHGNAHQQLPLLLQAHADAVLYLDPMYPPRRKSALVKKEMRMLRDLLGDDLDTADVLSLARAQGCRRVVVKRPGNAETLSNASPQTQIQSENTRYDVYLGTET